MELKELKGGSVAHAVSSLTCLGSPDLQAVQQQHSDLLAALLVVAGTLAILLPPPTVCGNKEGQFLIAKIQCAFKVL